MSNENEIVAIIKKVCVEILEIPGDEIAVDKSLFLFGADSISVAQIVNRVNDRFGVEDTFEQLFNTTTIEKYSQHIISMLKRGSV